MIFHNDLVEGTTINTHPPSFIFFLESRVQGLHTDSYFHEQIPFEVVLILAFATLHALWGSSYSEASLVGSL